MTDVQQFLINVETVSPFWAESGYEPKTTFWMDFSIADKFGTEAIEDTYNRAFEEWKDDVEYFAELVLVLNHKSWVMASRGDDEKGRLYADLYYKANDYGLEHFTEEEDAEYYFNVLD